MLDLYSWVNLGVSVVLPAIVALVTARLAHPGLKALILLVLAAVNGFATAYLAAVNAGQVFDAGHVAFSILISFVVAVVSHFGLLGPAGLTGSGGVIQMSLPAGLGASGRDSARSEGREAA